MAALDLEAPDHPGILGIACDVSERGGRRRGRSPGRGGAGHRVACWCSTPGIYPIVPFEETTLELWNRTLAINLTGAFLAARRALPGMREQGYGRVVGIGSSAGKAGGARSIAAYAASKGALMTMMKSIANEYAKFGDHLERPCAGAHRHRHDRRARATS